MQVSFGKFIPVRVFLDKKELDYRNEEEKEKRDDISNVFCRVLRNDKCIQDYALYEQQRRHFEEAVNDYKHPTGKYEKGFYPQAKVTPVTIAEVGRFIVTGKDVAIVEKLGKAYGHQKKLAEAQTAKAKEEKAKGNDEEAKKNEEGASRILQNAYNEQQRKLREQLMKNGKMHKKDVYIEATCNPDAGSIKEKYNIKLMDFKK